MRKKTSIEEVDEETRVKSLGFRTVKAKRVPSSALDPEKALSRKELVGIISEILKTLTFEESKVVQQHLMHGERLKTIGEELKIPPDKMKKLAACVLRKLRHPRHSERLRKFIRV